MPGIDTTCRGYRFSGPAFFSAPTSCSERWM